MILFLNMDKDGLLALLLLLVKVCVEFYRYQFSSYIVLYFCYNASLFLFFNLMQPKVRILLTFNKYYCFLEVKKYKTRILTSIQRLFFPNISNTTAFEWQFNFVLSVSCCYFCLSCVANSVALTQSRKSRCVVCLGSRARLFFHDKEKKTSQPTKSNFTVCTGDPLIEFISR